jgi:Protein of unknown function (DUF3244).
MKKVTTLVLMLSLVLSGALCYAHGTARTETKDDETPSIVIIRSNCGGTDKSGSIVPSIYDHVLSVMFTENLGQVAVEVFTALGVQENCLSVLTPNGLQVYIPNAGNYTVTFTLSDGDEYYGEFTVTD